MNWFPIKLQHLLLIEMLSFNNRFFSQPILGWMGDSNFGTVIETYFVKIIINKKEKEML